ncbi:hypothetical protein VOLCADRAFT_106295 [Volvox carteri f. nagariensis]|uniref:Uncharacterized protein n=1 Tax=Volvox carteri f. nagariensis TaxID=3068 RepID=D8U6F0_VOLCA|nr:uncharacterized protein VOLCADRAFT_106295 [Volvox carteri f. nagariensis]EFJ44633.1 hypothetical protein VOLCADRAFT_106295 [Volvox carteri f. nagariensis]|eukprot:XP_002954209.1 hypothetical protein VOLCADRAFT_106295 [Volvox carteri f. nagariensis]
MPVKFAIATKQQSKTHVGKTNNNGDNGSPVNTLARVVLLFFQLGEVAEKYVSTGCMSAAEAVVSPRFNPSIAFIRAVQKWNDSASRHQQDDVSGTISTLNLFGDAVLYKYQQQIAAPLLKLYGGRIVLMDVMYGLTSYNYPVISLLVVDQHDNGIPVAFGPAETRIGAGGAGMAAVQLEEEEDYSVIVE